MSRKGMSALLVLLLTACSATHQADRPEPVFEPDPTLATAIPQCRAQSDNVNMAAYCLNLYAVTRLRAGDIDNAIQLFREVLKLDPENVSVYEKLGEIYLNLGNVQQTMLAYRSAGELGSTNPNTFNNLGVAYAQLGDIPNAIASYRRAIQMRPNNARSHFNLGMVYVTDEERLDLAIEQFELAVSLDPSMAVAHYNLGEIYRYLGQRSLANDSYRRADQLGFEAAKPKIR